MNIVKYHLKSDPSVKKTVKVTQSKSAIMLVNAAARAKSVAEANRFLTKRGFVRG